MVKSSSNQQLDNRGTFHEKSQKFWSKNIEKGGGHIMTYQTLAVSFFFQTYREPTESLKQASSDRAAG